MSTQAAHVSCERSELRFELGVLPELQVALRPQTTKENRPRCNKRVAIHGPCIHGIGNVLRLGENSKQGEINDQSGILGSPRLEDTSRIRRVPVEGARDPDLERSPLRGPAQPGFSEAPRRLGARAERSNIAANRRPKDPG